MANADTALIQRCQANDAAAFNEIVSRYKDKVYNYVSRMVGPGTDSEDLTQETFVRAFTSIKSFQSRASLNTWLYRIATNICIDHSRKQSRHKALTTSLVKESADNDQDVEWEVPDERFNPQYRFLNKELGAQIQSALETLPEKLRMVVVLHDIEGLAYEEIAQIVECPLGTVKSRLFNARASLRASLTQYVSGSLEIDYRPPLEMKPQAKASGRWGWGRKKGGSQ